jgi:hypothetical protein
VAFGCRHGPAPSAPPTLAEEIELLHPSTRCDPIPSCGGPLFALRRTDRRHQGRDEAWDFERAPVNATKRAPLANRDYVEADSGATFFRANRLLHAGRSPFMDGGSTAAPLTR